MEGRGVFQFSDEAILHYNYQQIQSSEPVHHFVNESSNINSDEENAYSSSDPSSPVSDSDFNSANLSPSIRNIRPRRTERKVFGNRSNRTNFSEDQLQMLSEAFGYNMYPDSTEVDQLSSIVGVPRRKIITWFQNTRARLKRRGTTRNLRTKHINISASKLLTKVKSSRNDTVDNGDMNHKKKLEFDDDEMSTSRARPRGQYYDDLSPVSCPSDIYKPNSDLFCNVKFNPFLNTCDTEKVGQGYSPMYLPTMQQLLFDSNESSSVLHSGFISPNHDCSPEKDNESPNTKHYTSSVEETSKLLASSSAILAQNYETYPLFDFMFPTC